MKKTILMLFCFSLWSSFNAENIKQGLKISLRKMTAEGSNMPLINRTVQVVLNGHKTYTLTSDLKGNLKTLELPEGRYSIKLFDDKLNQMADVIKGTTSAEVEKGKITTAFILYDFGQKKRQVKLKNNEFPFLKLLFALAFQLPIGAFSY